MTCDHVNSSTQLRTILDNRVDAKTLLCVAIVIILSIISVWPVLKSPQRCILDYPSLCEHASNIDLTNPRTYFTIPEFSVRAFYGFLLYLFPCYFSTAAIYRAWTYSGLLLIATTLMTFSLAYRITGRRVLGLLAVIPWLFSPSFTENYYTLFKSEPYISFGILMTSWLLWRAAFETRRPDRYFMGFLNALLAVLAALCVYSMKETSIAFVGIYFVGIMVCVIFSPLCWVSVLKRTSLISIANIVCFGILVVRIMRLPARYNAGGLSEYSLRPNHIANGLVGLGSYFWDTTPGVAIGIVALLLAAYMFVSAHIEIREKLVKIAWTAYFYILFFAMAGILAPWSEITQRYYLPATASYSVALALTMGLICDACKLSGRRFFRWSAVLLSLVMLVLVIAHALYSVLVGQWSEGRVRHRFDKSYNQLFDYISVNALSNSALYLLMDWRLPEPKKNSRISLRLFYDRPDINCIFPMKAGDITKAGLIAVSDYHIPMNYDRMPVHHEANALYYRTIAPHLQLLPVTSFVYYTKIWYATNTCHGPQYNSIWGMPAFWELKRSTYRFGWTIYAVTSVPVVLSQVVNTLNTNIDDIVTNGNFGRELAAWSPWGIADQRSNKVRVVRTTAEACSAYALRVENPAAALLGMKQHVPLVSGAVYRLSASARSVATTASKVLFGGRVALFLPPQPEQQIIWMSEYDRWWPKSLVFTNQASGTAVLYVHMGYGKVASTGEFSDIRLERIGQK